MAPFSTSSIACSRVLGEEMKFTVTDFGGGLVTSSPTSGSATYHSICSGDTPYSSWSSPRSQTAVVAL